MICSAVNIDIVMFSVSHRDKSLYLLRETKPFCTVDKRGYYTQAESTKPLSPWAYWQVEVALILGMQFDTDLAVYCMYSSHMWLPKLRREYFMSLSCKSFISMLF